MTRYLNAGGDSGIVGYDCEENAITVYTQVG